MMRLEGVFAVEVYRGVQIWGQCSYDECQYWSDLETYTYDTVEQVRARIDAILGGGSYISSLEVSVVNPQYGDVYVQAPYAVIISGLYMFASADTIIIEMQPKTGYVVGNVYVDSTPRSIPASGGQLSLVMNVNHNVLINFGTEAPPVPEDEFISTYKGYDVWLDHYLLNNILYDRYGVYVHGVHVLSERMYSSVTLQHAYDYIDELTKEEIPITWKGPETLESGVYQWSIKFNIMPIPFLDNYIVDLIAATQDDETNINAALQQQGYAGSATILDKAITKHTNSLGNVDSFTLTYKVAFSSNIQAVAYGQSLVFPFVLLGYFIVALVPVAVAVIMYLAIKTITSTIVKIFGPSDYTPVTPGECADGWTYDADTGQCVKTTAPTSSLVIPVVIGALGVAYLSRR